MGRPFPVLAIAGCALLGLLWLGPLPVLASSTFVAHMALHMGVIAIAAPLIVAGVAGGPLDPVRRRPALFGPLPAALLEFVVVWSWHAPVLHRAARGSSGLFLVEQVTFLGAGLLVWFSAFGGDRPFDGSRTGAGAGALLLTSMHMTLLGTLIALAPRPLYHHADSGRGVSMMLQDQQLGGTLMLIVGGAVYLVGGVMLVARLLRTGDPGEAVP